MCYVYYILIISFPYISSGGAQSERKVPDGFLFGVATSAYQTEGAWNISGKTESIWDEFVHAFPSLILDGGNGDVAADSYHMYKDDIDLLHTLGVQFYRFSLSWTRILPTGFSNYVNKEGVEYYNNVINELLAKNIEPMITIYHIDLPFTLQQLGGWSNPLMAQYFEDYAEVVFEKFSDRVKYWITVNEPMVECFLGYSQSYQPPRINMNKIAEYLCMHNLLKAHSNAYHLYKDKYDVQKTGKIGIAHQMTYVIPDVSTVDVNYVFNWMGSIILHPIFSETGNYPPEIQEIMTNISYAEGYPRSRLPVFTPEEIEKLKGSADFLGLNHYTSYKYVPSTVDEFKVSTFFSHVDWGVKDVIDDRWPKSSAQWITVYPQGLRGILNWIKDKYNNPNIIITENGFASNSETELLLDEQRVSYLTQYLSATLDAIYEDGCNVQGYTAWSLIDIFEWMDGYTNTFGLHCVDFSSPNKTRVRKMSAFVYEDIIRSRTLKANYDQFMQLNSNRTIGFCRSGPIWSYSLSNFFKRFY